MMCRVRQMMSVFKFADQAIEGLNPPILEEKTESLSGIYKIYVVLANVLKGL